MGYWCFGYGFYRWYGLIEIHTTVVTNGRWKNEKDISHYVSQGAKDGQGHTEGGCKDPIWKTWVWKPVTRPSDDGTSQM